MYIKKLPTGVFCANCYILCDEKSKDGAVIDVGDCTEELLSEIKRAGIENLKYILCTHGHFDHISGIPVLKKEYENALVVTGKNDAELLFDTEKSLAEAFGFFQQKFYADKTVEDGDVLSLGETKLRVLETPGHSPGGVCYVCDKEKVVFSGDTLFRYSIGRTDMWGSDYTTLLNSLDRLMLLDDTFKVFPGHNQETTIGNERENNRYIRRK